MAADWREMGDKKLDVGRTETEKQGLEIRMEIRS